MTASNTRQRDKKPMALFALPFRTGLLTLLAAKLLNAMPAQAEAQARLPASDCGTNAAAQPIGSTAFDATDRLAVINLINSYGYLNDSFGPAHFDELFTPDATIVMRAGDKVLVDGLAQFKEFAGKRHAKLSSENIQRRHVLSAPRFDYQDANTASGQVYLRYYETKRGAAPVLGSIGVYDFRAVKSDGRWKLNCWIARADG